MVRSLLKSKKGFSEILSIITCIILTIFVIGIFIILFSFIKPDSSDNDKNIDDFSVTTDHYLLSTMLRTKFSFYDDSTGTYDQDYKLSMYEIFYYDLKDKYSSSVNDYLESQLLFLNNDYIIKNYYVYHNSFKDGMCSYNGGNAKDQKLALGIYFTDNDCSNVKERTNQMIFISKGITDYKKILCQVDLARLKINNKCYKIVKGVSKKFTLI